MISGSGQFQDIDSKKDHYEAQPFGLNDRLVVIHNPQVQMRVKQPMIEIPQTVENDLVDQVADKEPQMILNHFHRQ